MRKRHSIFVSVAEDSADVHAAALVRAAGRELPGAAWYGLTGPRLRALGVETIYDLAAHAAMLTRIFSAAGRALEAIRLVEKAWDRNPPDLVVLLDSPELHLRLAERAKLRGLGVLYYIAPQTWASRAGRNAQIARCVDRLACILPFEESYFRKFGIAGDYVGHPLFESLSLQRPDGQLVARLRASGEPVIALLPGSRRHVIQTMLPHQLAVLHELQLRGVGFRAAISCVADDRAGQIRDLLAGQPHVTADVVVADNATLLTAADLVLVASGTAALEVAHYRKPMIVMYDAGALLGAGHRWFGRAIVKTPHLSLVNILANARVVPEYMPSLPHPGEIAATAAQLLRDGAWRRLMIDQMDAVVAPLESSGASTRVCQIIHEMLGAAAPRAGASLCEPPRPD